MSDLIAPDLGRLAPERAEVRTALVLSKAAVSPFIGDVGTFIIDEDVDEVEVTLDVDPLTLLTDATFFIGETGSRSPLSYPATSSCICLTIKLKSVVSISSSSPGEDIINFVRLCGDGVVANLESEVEVDAGTVPRG